MLAIPVNCPFIQILATGFAAQGEGAGDTTLKRSFTPYVSAPSQKSFLLCADHEIVPVPVPSQKVFAKLGDFQHS